MSVCDLDDVNFINMCNGIMPASFSDASTGRDSYEASEEDLMESCVHSISMGQGLMTDQGASQGLTCERTTAAWC